MVAALFIKNNQIEMLNYYDVISLAEAKADLRLEHEFEDSLIERKIKEVVSDALIYTFEKPDLTILDSLSEIQLNSFRLACMKLLVDSYENRGDGTYKNYELNNSAWKSLDKLKNYPI